MQRIVKTDVHFAQTGSYTIQIQPINLSKSIRLVNNCVYRPELYVNNRDNGVFVISTLQASSIKLTSNGSNEYGTISTKVYEAQVVEFY